MRTASLKRGEVSQYILIEKKDGFIFEAVLDFAGSLVGDVGEIMLSRNPYTGAIKVDCWISVDDGSLKSQINGLFNSVFPA